MDWRVNSHNDQPHAHRKRHGWKFSYWGDTGELDTGIQNIIEEDNTNSPYPLTAAKVGQTVWLVGFQGKNGQKQLMNMGLFPGEKLEIISTRNSGSVLVATQEKQIGIGAGMADKVLVSNNPVTVTSVHDSDSTKTYLRELPVGTMGCVVGYDKARRGYKGKLLSMGLTPGTPFKVIRVAPLGDPIEIELRGFHLSLRKYEADALVVEPLENED
ncbi:MAG: ferrous iron transport protein A [Kamptonema sp. SIO4C4]|nr:ferrous iron transport protein A [Kamptonema sp. SIO4C4]